MKIRTLLLCVAVTFLAGGATASSTSSRIFDAVKYGAQPDGRTLCTAAIQRAIDDCGAAGGGTVLLSGGIFLSGTIVLKNDVTLRIDEDSTLLGSANGDDYPRIRPESVRSFNDGRTQKQLIYGENLTNVAIIGKGVIDGQGGTFPKAPRGATPDRPFVIRLVACRNVLVEDIQMRSSGFWMQHYLECDDLTVRRIRVVNHSNWNNDTIDIDGCHRVRIEGVVCDSSDDGITFKSTTLRSCEDIFVAGCTIRTHAVGIKFGTESIGGFKRIQVKNCVILRSEHREGGFGGKQNGKGGIALMSLDGAALEDVEISDIRIEGTVSPIFIRLHDRGRAAEPGKTKPIGHIRNVTLRNITAIGAETTGSLVSGISGHPIENLVMQNIRIATLGGGKLADVRFPSEGLEKAAGAGPGMFGLQPASGIHFHHVTGLMLDNLVMETVKPDERPGLVFSQVVGVKLNGRALTAEEPLPAGVEFRTNYISIPASKSR